MESLATEEEIDLSNINILSCFIEISKTDSGRDTRIFSLNYHLMSITPATLVESMANK